MAEASQVSAAFEVTNLTTGQRFAVFADGRIEGFGDGCVVMNRIPQLLESAVREGIWLAQNRPELIVWLKK